MKLFKTNSGMIISFGFNMRSRCEDPHMICWNDPEGSWDIGSGSVAGWQIFEFSIDPEFVFEGVDGVVHAVQPGLCIQMEPTGNPMMWAIRMLRP